MTWWYILISCLLPIIGFAVGFILGRDHEGRQHAQRRRVVNER